MSTEYEGVATWRTAVTLPSDSDLRNATSINAANEDLADRTAWLKQFAWPTESVLVQYFGSDYWWSGLDLPGSTDPRYGTQLHIGLRRLADRCRFLKERADELTTLVADAALQCTPRLSFTNLSPSAFYPLSFTDSAPPELRLINDGSNQYAKFKSNGGGLGAGFEAVPQLATVTGIVARVQGDPGAHGAPPGNPPVLRLYRKNDSGVVTLLASQTDPSATVEAYETMHEIPMTGLSQAVRSGAGDLQIVLVNEGVSGVANLRVAQIQVAYNLTYYIWG